MTKWYNNKMTSARISNNSITEDAPLTFYQNSPELTDLNPKHVRIISGNVIGSQYFPSSDITGSDIAPSDVLFEEMTFEDGTTDANGNADASTNLVPDLSDITLVSNLLKYDATGNPYAEVIFKVKNSSGVILKGVNARVSII